VKFLCDRCKTRYSIGDERVRGKILKIRCKNCANVITVREGMAADPDASAPVAPEYAGRAKKTTTVAPAVMQETPEAGRAPGATAASEPASAASVRAGVSPGTEAGARAQRPAAGAAGRDPAVVAKDRQVAAQAQRARGDDAPRGQAGAARRTGGELGRSDTASALNAAFASAMAKPPPALEEEWYVSIDGEQDGPFSLGEAQRWVSQKSFDAELHCWSEGFDDWLPVDKVSHFRGLRKRPAPPPTPRPAGPPPRAAPPPRVPAVEEEPKPLFAATMASLERGAPPASSPAIALPPPAARATPPRGTALPARNNVAASLPAAGAARRPGSAPFDTSEAGEPASPLEGRPFRDPVLAPRAASEPGVGGAARPSSSDAALTTPHLPAASTLHGTGANAAVTVAAVTATAGEPEDSRALTGDEDADLDIGEVSRVVKLADIVRTPRSAERAGGKTGAVGRQTAAVARLTGANAMLRATGAQPSLAAPPTGEVAPAALPDGDPSLTMAPVARSHRRGLITLLSVAGVLVLGVVGAVVLFVTTGDDPSGGRLGSVRDIDTSRPENPITHRPLEPGPPGTGSSAPVTPRPNHPRPNPPPNPPVGSNHDPEPAIAGPSLRSEEIEDTARKHQDMTQRCYLRSQRGADSIIVGDVKKIAVTLMIDRDGNVSDVQLSEHGADNLGKCLIGSMRGWKFRPSSGGSFRFSLNFVSG